MVNIQFDFETEGVEHDTPFLDPYEIHLMFEQTKQSMRAGIERKLAGLTCPEHQQAPTVTITGRYNNESEDMDISYHIDTCCKPFFMRVVQTLNNVG